MYATIDKCIDGHSNAPDHFQIASELLAMNSNRRARFAATVAGPVSDDLSEDIAENHAGHGDGGLVLAAERFKSLAVTWGGRFAEISESDALKFARVARMFLDQQKASCLSER